MRAKEGAAEVRGRVWMEEGEGVARVRIQGSVHLGSVNDLTGTGNRFKVMHAHIQKHRGDTNMHSRSRAQYCGHAIGQGRGKCQALWSVHW